MLAEDLSLDLWSQFHQISEQRQSDSRSKIALADCSEDLGELLLGAVSGRRAYRSGLSDTLGELAKLLASELVMKGDVTFEIAYGWNNAERVGRPGAAALRPVPHGSLCRFLGRTYQIIPENVRAPASERCVVRLGSDRLVRFSLPPWRRRIVAQMRVSLPLIGVSQDEWMRRSAIGLSREPFANVHRDYNIALARATADVGWHGRGLLQEHTMDFHFMARALRWKRFCIEVREQILTTLADAFSRIGAVFGEHPRLIVDGLPTLADVDAAEARLASGPTRFDELLKPPD